MDEDQPAVLFKRGDLKVVQAADGSGKSVSLLAFRLFCRDYVASYWTQAPKSLRRYYKDRARAELTNR